MSAIVEAGLLGGVPRSNVDAHVAPVMRGRADMMISTTRFANSIGMPQADAIMRAVDKATATMLSPPGGDLPEAASLMPRGVGLGGEPIARLPSGAPGASNAGSFGAAAGSMGHAAVSEDAVNAKLTTNRIICTPLIANFEPPIDGEFVLCRREKAPDGFQPQHVRTDRHNYARRGPPQVSGYQVAETPEMGIVQMNYAIAQLQLDRIKEVTQRVGPGDAAKRVDIKKISDWARNMIGGPDARYIVPPNVEDAAVVRVSPTDEANWRDFRSYFIDGLVYQAAPVDTNGIEGGHAEYYRPPAESTESAPRTICQVIQGGRYEEAFNYWGEQATAGASLYLVERAVSVRALANQMRSHYASYYDTLVAPMYVPQDVPVVAGGAGAPAGGLAKETLLLVYAPTFTKSTSSTYKTPQSKRLEYRIELDTDPESVNYDHLIWQIVPVAMREGGRIDRAHLRPRRVLGQGDPGLFDFGLRLGAAFLDIIMPQRVEGLVDDLTHLGRDFFVGRVLADKDPRSMYTRTHQTRVQRPALSPDDAWPVFDTHPITSRGRIDVIVGVQDLTVAVIEEGTREDIV